MKCVLAALEEERNRSVGRFLSFCGLDGGLAGGTILGVDFAIVFGAIFRFSEVIVLRSNPSLLLSKIYQCSFSLKEKR